MRQPVKWYIDSWRLSGTVKILRDVNILAYGRISREKNGKEASKISLAPPRSFLAARSSNLTSYK